MDPLHLRKACLGPCNQHLAPTGDSCSGAASTMAKRLAVLLVFASLVLIALADMPSAEVSKYKEHEKHEKVTRQSSAA